MEKNIKNIVMTKQKKDSENDEKRAGCEILVKQQRECRIRTSSSRPWARGTAKKKKNTANDKLTFRLSFYWHIY